MNGSNGRAKVESILKANTRIVAYAIILVLLLDVMIAVRHGISSSPTGNQAAGTTGGTTGSTGTTGTTGLPTINPSGTPTAGTTSGGPSPNVDRTIGKKPGSYVPGLGTIPYGVTKDTIDVVYYWKGDRTMSSPYLGPTGQKGAVDEADAFQNFLAYINAHANGGATFMGFPFNLHGRKLKVGPKQVYEAGQYEETFATTAESIHNRKPFVAISSHGGLSDYVCDDLYKNKIFNIATYDLGRYTTSGGLYRGTNGYCLPQGLSWEKQVEVSVSWLSDQSKTTKYASTTGPVKRIYGIVYGTYPGLKESVDRLKVKLHNVGIDVAATYEMPWNLSDSAKEAPSAVAKMKGKHVNTIIMPDGGAPITFTHAAQGNNYNPDYYVWPCSGEDAVGQVRLFDAAQWTRAQGLSCYDENWGLDLTLDDNARATQWFKQYQSAAGQKDPPSTSPLVYQALLPVLVGITNAGRELTVEKFRAGIEAFRYPGGLTRYHAIKGPTTSSSHFMVTVGCPDESQIGDVAEVRWSATKRTSGNATAGYYVYSSQRYRPGASFS
jgi:substrate-binding family protein